MKIAPDAKLDDGYFDVVTIGDANAFRLLTNAPRLYLGAHLRMSEVTHALAKQVVARRLIKKRKSRGIGWRSRRPAAIDGSNRAEGLARSVSVSICLYRSRY